MGMISIPVTRDTKRRKRKREGKKERGRTNHAVLQSDLVRDRGDQKWSNLPP